jgi:tyrosyl-tRNA synthetase
LQKLEPDTFLELFEGVPQAEITREQIQTGLDIIAALASETGFLNSNGEARRAIKENAISVNQSKVDQEYTIGEKDLIANQYVLLQRGKKNYFILKIAS